MNNFLFNYILRNIYKFIYKICRPNTYKHNRRFWPLYQVERNITGDLQKVFFRKTLVSDNTSPITPFNKKCMLITTGPSVNTLDPTIFNQNDIDYIGVNGAISLKNIHFSHYIIIDHNFIDCRFDLVQDVLKTDCIFFTTPRCLDMILRRINFQDIHCQIKTIETIKNHLVEVFLDKETTINREHKAFCFSNNFGFSKNIFSGVFDYFTVAYVALQIAYYLDYQEIYLAGLDMNNFSKPRFYENTENKQPTLLDLHIDNVLSAFDNAAHFLSQQNIKVFNLSSDSAVQSFPKIDVNVLFKH
ncbi:MAG: lipopolysaccharide biosynthesis protein [Proteobacteria bacterium]|nr:lipopolysaccharide biosynthesis protein [Pseudomonadota bacterium]MDA1254199.1 lipopolysaccharide biosynthesis protein [Pseudomonadota bacterium]